MKTIITSNWRPLCRALCTLLVGIAAFLKNCLDGLQSLSGKARLAAVLFLPTAKPMKRIAIVAPRSRLLRRAICASFVVVPAVLSLVATAPAYGDPTLTGAIEFSTDASGNFVGGQGWNTFGGDAPDNLYVTAANSGINGPFLNTGNSNPATEINAPLEPGIYTFNIFANQGVDVGSFGLNLFFDSNDVNPGISVYAPTAYSAPPPSPAFLANTSADTANLQFTQVVPGAGTLNFEDGPFTVSLTDYWFANPGVFNLDRTQGYDSSPGGANDFVGQFTLNVVPEPGSLPLVIVGLSLFLGLAVRRTNGVSASPSSES